MTMYFKQRLQSGVTDYTAVSDTPVFRDGRKSYPSANFSVSDPESIPNFRPGPGGLVPDYDVYEKDADDITTLFQDRPAEVSSAFAHSSMRHSIPVLGALAKKEFPGMVSSYDLSPHSSKLTRKAMQLGIIQPHPWNLDAHATNDYDFEDFEYTQPEYNIDWRVADNQEVPEHEIKEARAYLKSVLRPQKPHTSAMGGPQFEQERLPGVEW